MRWIPFPFIRIALFFIAGILLGIYYPDVLSDTVVWPTLLCLVFLYFLVFIIWPSSKKFITGVIGLSVVFMAGYVHLTNQTSSRKQDNILNAKDTIEFYVAKINRAPEEKDRSWRVEAKVNAVKAKGQWKNSEGKVQFYFPKKDFL